MQFQEDVSNYSFAQRDNCAVFDDIRVTIVLKKWPTSIDELASLCSSGEIYLKNMAHHQENQSLDWVKPTAYIF